jgi:hypothetical protein
MKINREWLDLKHACNEGVEWFTKKFVEIDSDELIDVLLADKQIWWANWLIINIISKEDCIKYAVFVAELVLPLFEEKYPTDNRPKNAIIAVKTYFNNLCSMKIGREKALTDAAVAAKEAKMAAWSTWRDTDAVKTYDAAAAADMAVETISWATGSWESATTTKKTILASTIELATLRRCAENTNTDAKNTMLIDIINYGRSLLKQNRSE